MKQKFKTLGLVIGKFILLIAFWILSIVLADSLTTIIDKQGKPTSIFLFEFIPFLGLLLGHLVMTKFFEKSNLSFARIYRNSILNKFLVGFGIGIIWLTVSVLTIYMLGNGKFTNNFSITAINLLLYFLILFINAGMQELLVHGYLLSLLEKKYSKLIGLIVTSLLFLLLHPGAINSGIIASINVFCAGLLFGLITIKFDSLFSATVAHTTWNYFGAVWLGLIPLDNYPSMKLIAVSGNPFIVGDKNGIETSIIVTITVLILLTIIIKNSRQQGFYASGLPTHKADAQQPPA